jgi:hypothetical protein
VERGGEAHRRIHGQIALRRKGERRLEAVDDVLAHNCKTMRGQMDAVEIKRELVLQRCISNAGRELACAYIRYAVWRGIGLDQVTKQGDVDKFDAHAVASDAGKSRLHLAVGGADQRVRVTDRFRQLADIAVTSRSTPAARSRQPDRLAG